MNIGTDLGFHAYGTWFAQHQLQLAIPRFDFDFFTNSIFGRTYPTFFYLLSGILASLVGYWNSAGLMVVASYLILATGVFFLSKQMGLENRFAFLAGVAAIFSYSLAIEGRIWGSLTRVFAYSLLPWMLFFAEKIPAGRNNAMLQKKALYFALLTLTLAAGLLTHPLTFAYFLMILASWRALGAFFSSQGKEKPSNGMLGGEAKTVLASILLAIAISAVFILPFFFEKDYTNLERYFHPSAIAANAQNMVVSLVIPFVLRSKVVSSIYLGLGLLFLASYCIWKLKSQPPAAKTSLALFTAFTLVTIFPNAFPMLNQTVSRPAFFASFFLAISAAFGARALEATLARQVKNLKQAMPQWLPFIVLFAAVFIDLNPAWIPMPGYNFPPAPAVQYYYLTLDYQDDIPGRFITGSVPLQDDVSLVSLTSKKTLYDPPERLNPEYYSFVQGLGFLSSKDPISFGNKAVLLDVTLLVKQLGNTAELEGTWGKAGFVGKGVFLDFPTVGAAEAFFENLSSQAGFNPEAAVFILPKTRPSNPDMQFNEQNSSTAIQTLEGHSTQEFPVDVDEKNVWASFTPPADGFAFVSLMHYPLWKAYAGGRQLPLLESGGGLIAVEGVRKGEKVTLKFEKPWYDYAGILISLAGIAMLALALKIPKIRKKLFQA